MRLGQLPFERSANVPMNLSAVRSNCRDSAGLCIRGEIA